MRNNPRLKIGIGKRQSVAETVACLTDYAESVYQETVIDTGDYRERMRSVLGDEGADGSESAILQTVQEVGQLELTEEGRRGIIARNSPVPQPKESPIPRSRESPNSQPNDSPRSQWTSHRSNSSLGSIWDPVEAGSAKSLPLGSPRRVESPPSSHCSPIIEWENLNVGRNSPGIEGDGRKTGKISPRMGRESSGLGEESPTLRQDDLREEVQLVGYTEEQFTPSRPPPQPPNSNSSSTLWSKRGSKDKGILFNSFSTSSLSKQVLN